MIPLRAVVVRAVAGHPDFRHMAPGVFVRQADPLNFRGLSARRCCPPGRRARGPLVIRCRGATSCAPDFAEHVRQGLEVLTVEQVNAAVRRHLKADDVLYVFVTGEASDLERRLADDRPSPVEYNSDQPEALLEEDRIIQSLEFGPGSVEVKPVEENFD